MMTDLTDPRPLSGLTIAELRAYRGALRAEEDRVSYWRRVTHGRIDVLTAERPAGQAITHAQLVSALADTGTGRARSDLRRIAAVETLPDLPELDAQIWSAVVDHADRAAVQTILVALHRAEQQLTEYRTALLGLLDEATAALVQRYKEDPRLALDLLAGPAVR